VTRAAAALANACLFPSFPGLEPPGWIRSFLAAGGGGIVLFSYNIAAREQLATLAAELRSERPEALVAIDEEGGDVTRLEASEGSSYPGNAALGAVDDVGLTDGIAASVGAELAAAGINWNLAPVADVNAPKNPVIGVRSFGSEPVRVAAHVAAFVRGLQRAGVAACVKHFPGHGSTAQDSHVELPTVVGPVEAGLEPFRAAVEAGAQTIMTAHVRVPKLGDVPATINPLVVTGILRGDLRFDGVVMADALEMKGLSAAMGVEEAAVQALAAGVDALCVGHDLGEGDVAQIRAAIVAAVDAGRLPVERLEEAAARLRRVGEWTLQERPSIEVDRALGSEAARRALVVEGDVVVPSGASVVELRPPANIAAGDDDRSFASAVIVREGEVAPRADVVVVRDAHRHSWMRDAADADGCVVVEVGLPVWRPPRSRGYLATYGRSRVSLEAAAERLGLLAGVR
jgi:beta-N-acetylhexosaminidase